jgi:adenine-specific DNA-methyltransferase
MEIANRWDANADVSLYHGDTMDLLRELPDEAVQLAITSPPYNIAKQYERKERLSPEQYLAGQAAVIAECVRVLRPGGSLCWQVGNHVVDGRILPIDILLYPAFACHSSLALRNRIVWHFEHGLHCNRRFSGRYEVLLWFTKGDSYAFDLDPIRVPQKYPGKRAWKGTRVGEYTGNPLGKNPGDVWVFPNVKANHIEKTIHPCQFPIELVERFLLSTTVQGDLILDPYMGVGTVACAAVLHRRRAVGAEIVAEYIQIARHRIALAAQGTLQTRPMHRPVHQPDPKSALARRDGAHSAHPTVRSRSPAQGLRIATEAGLLEHQSGKEPTQLKLACVKPQSSPGLDD